MAGKNFQTRGFVSLLTFGSFLVMSITGILLFAAPHDMIERWINWKFWGIGKSQWGAIHIISCFTFIVVGIYHLVNNWESLKQYLAGKIASGLAMKKESGIALLIVVVMIVGPLFNVPPFQYVLEFGDILKTSWIVTKEYEPPFPRAEGVTLSALAKRQNLDLDKVLQELEAKGMKAKPGDSLQTIAAKNGTTPMLIYRDIKKFEVVPSGSQR
jgi:hypothetical protein